MSLRDQLLKAGAVSKKKAKQAENAAKKQRHTQQKTAKLGELEPDAVLVEIERKRLAQQEADKARNIQIQNQKEQEAHYYHIRDILLQHDLLASWGPERYYFKKTLQIIASIQVSKRQIKQLATGEIGIVSGDLVGKDFVLLSKNHCQQLAGFDGSFLLCLHRDDGEPDDLDGP